MDDLKFSGLCLFIRLMKDRFSMRNTLAKIFTTAPSEKCWFLEYYFGRVLRMQA